jgi:hypothetical protein
VDEYHLQIQRGSDLMGRWYLADVEVVRDIAERFTLFLGDDEMEFLADDALVFAYEGVTRMQEGWVKAQKKKRRHRRAAAEAARRKDETPDEPETVVTEPSTGRRLPRRAEAKPPTSELAKKLAAIAAAEDTDTSASPLAQRLARVEELASAASEADKSGDEPEAPDWAAIREEMAVGRSEPAPLQMPEPEPEEPLSIPPIAEPLIADAGTGHLKRREAQPAPEPAGAELWLEIEPAATVEADWIEEPSEEAWPEPAWVTPPEAVMTEPEVAPSWIEPAWISPNDAPQDGDLRRRFEALEQAARTKSAPPDGDIIVEPETRTRRGTKARERARSKPAQDTVLERAPEPKSVEPRGDGHHPIESNTGLLAKLRRAPKVPDDHVHVYEESRSTGGLTRRVCIECSHVSFLADD